MNNIIAFMKKEAVLLISCVLALLSMCAVAPDLRYAEYIDWRTLSILWSLMLVVAGLRELGLFAMVGKWLIAKTATARGMVLAFVMMNFFFGMVITNDVALITFVPFAIAVLTMSSLEKYMIQTIVLETIAANLGSMLTPIGNPQNLYLYSLSGMELGEFIRLLLPYSAVALVLLVIATIFLIGKEPTELTKNTGESTGIASPIQMGIYVLLFLFSLTAVLRLVPFYVVLAVVLLAVLLMDKGGIRRADYSLLLTFLFLFIFIGNLKRIDVIHLWLSQLVQGNEVISGVVASQVISNVPAAILLSGFSDNISALLIGVNLGGLGTLIASMASLISFKFYCGSKNSSAGKFMGVFTLWNLAFLAVLLVVHYFLI